VYHSIWNLYGLFTTSRSVLLFAAAALLRPTGFFGWTAMTVTPSAIAPGPLSAGRLAVRSYSPFALP